MRSFKREKGVWMETRATPLLGLLGLYLLV